MLDFLLWLAVISTGLCVIIFLCVVGVLLLIVIDKVKSATPVALPDPDPRAERTFGQKYFERAIGKKLN